MHVQILLTQVLLWFELEFLRRGSAQGGGVRDARAKAQPVHCEGPRPRDTATFRPLRWQRFMYRLQLEVANQEDLLRTNSGK